MRIHHKECIIAGICLVCFVFGGMWICRREDRAAFSPTFPQQLLLIIDAGHGGADGGAVSKSGTVESGLNLAIAKRLQLFCGLFGVPHTMTRWDENSIHDADAYTLREQKRSDLNNRVELINQTENCCLISIHQNIYEGSSSKGAQVFYGGENSKLWAEETQRLLICLDGENHRQAAKISDSVYLMKHITCPAILVECGFLSNSRDEILLQNETYQTKLATVLLVSFLTRQQIGDTT